MKDVRKLSGRGTDDTLTTFINRRILQELPIKPQDRLVDIGCGDGTLLRAALQVGAGEVIGLTGTEEEAEALRALGLNVKYALSNSLPFPYPTSLPLPWLRTVSCTSFLPINYRPVCAKLPASPNLVPESGSAKYPGFASPIRFAHSTTFPKCCGGCCESGE